MNVLVACEFSGIVRDEFIKLGHNAWSCDLLPTKSPGPHLQCGVLSILDKNWDLMIAHPPCTYLCNSGVRWLYERAERWELMRKATKFFRMLLNAPIKHICIENPIPHKYAIIEIGRKYDQIIQPYQFGEPYSKATCLWLKNLPKLIPTKVLSRDVVQQSVWKMSSSKDHWKKRNKTYVGIAKAMAEQWGTVNF